MRFHFSEIIFIVGFVAYVVIRGVFEQRAKASSIVVKRVNTGETALLIVMALGGMVIPVVYLLTPFLAFADYRLPQLVSYAGTAILLCSLWLFWRAHADLAENWSRTLEMRQDHKLVTRGVYRSIRHPMYAAIWLFSLAQWLLLQNWFAGWPRLLRLLSCISFALEMKSE